MQYITYKKENLPVKISYSALKNTINHHRKETGDQLDLQNIMAAGIDIYEPLLFYGLRAGYKAEEKEFPWKIEDMEFILDDCLMEFIQAVSASFPTDAKSKQ